MSSGNGPTGREDPIAPQVRPLPAAPSLEYERKSAKALLRQIRAGNDEALRRVQLNHPVSLRDRRPAELKLADAQHVIAREYGFTSWPRLVEYFEELERHRNGPRHNSSDDDMEQFEAQARFVISRHQRGDTIVARELAHFVPRFYGRPAPEILGTPITDDEARLVVAREHRRVSWDELLERASASRTWRDRKMWQDEDAQIAKARDAIRAQDVYALAEILDEHPEVLEASVVDREWRSTLVSLAVSLERDARTIDARRVTDLLASRGADIQRELDERLLGWPLDWGHPERVTWYLDRGANPNWMPPNGITVLEHAIVRWKNSECVDAIAARVTPRRALWIAAGLGDVPSVRSFIAGQGRLTPEGRQNRPDLMAMGWLASLPPDQDADDLDIMWEAFQLAGWNGRWAAMDALLASGLPVDHAPAGWPLLMEAVGNMLLPLAEYLISRGADLDHEWPSGGSARAMARMSVSHDSDPQSEGARRLLAMCGAGTPEKILAERSDSAATRMLRRVCAFLAFTLASCDADPGRNDAVRRDSAGVTIVESSAPAWRSTGPWSLADTPSVSIGVREGPEEYQFTRIISASVLPDSTIAVANFTNPPEIRAYTLEGEHLWSAGGEGAGPGEFQGISWIDHLSGDTLRVFDFWQARMSYFDFEGDLLTVQPLSEVAGQFMTSFVLSPGLDGGRLVARNNQLIPRDASGRGRALTPVLTIDRMGAVLDTIAIISDAEYYVSGDGERSIVAFGPRAGILAAGQWIYVHTGESYRIDVYAPDGRLHRSYRRHEEPRAVRPEDMEAFIEARLALARSEDERKRMEREYRETPHSDVMPAYDRSMLLDPSGNLWVKQYTAPLDSLTEWAVTSPDGTFLGLVSIPLAFTLSQVGDSFVLGVWRDDLAVESLRVYELRKPR